jgi:hypothetical protein
MEGVSSSATSVNSYQTTRLHIQKISTVIIIAVRTYVIQFTLGLLNHCSQCVGARGSNRSPAGRFCHGVCGPIKHDQDSGNTLPSGLVPHSHRQQLRRGSVWQASDRRLGR